MRRQLAPPPPSAPAHPANSHSWEPPASLWWPRADLLCALPSPSAGLILRAFLSSSPPPVRLPFLAASPPRACSPAPCFPSSASLFLSLPPLLAPLSTPRLLPRLSVQLLLWVSLVLLWSPRSVLAVWRRLARNRSNVGYGYASGYLQNRRIPFSVPGGQTQDSAAGSQSSMRSDVNPVTGQFFASEPKTEGPPMTDDEKEREAERLFVLFERLKKTGIVDVKNPVEEAVQSGRFEELPDD